MRKYLLQHIDPGFIAALALTLPILFPFLTGRLPDTADAQLHLHRMVSAALNLHNGILYPRWSPHLHLGYGYPLHNFYAPGWHIIAGGFYSVFGGNAVHFWLAAQAVGVMLTAPGAYLFARTFAPRPGALAAAAAYAWTPIRFREIWDQGNVSQLISMALIAWGFWAMASLARRPSPGKVALAGLIIGFSVINHHPTAFYFIPALAVYAVLAGWLASENSDALRRIAICMSAFALGILFSAVYWLPAALEVKYTLLDSFTTGQFDIASNFTPLRELLSATPFLDRGAYVPFRPMNIGLVQLIVAIVGFLLAIRARHLTRWQKGHVIAAAVALPVCIYLMTASSAWFWEHAPLADKLVYPWRLLGLVAVLMVPGIALLPEALPQRWRNMAAMSILIVVVVSMLPAAYPTRDTLAFNQPVTAATAQAYEHSEGVLGMVSGNEYLPKWTTFQNRPDSTPDMSLYENLDWYFTLNDVPEGVQIQQSDSAAHRSGERFSIESDSAFPMHIRQMYFPGWKAALDGDSIETTPSGDEGLLTLQIPAGSHTLEVWYGGTTAQHLGDDAALLALAICVLLFAWELRRRNYHSADPLQHQRFAFGVLALSLGWLVFNQAYVIPHTDWFRPRSPVTDPAAMQTRFTEQFFQPGIGFRLELLGYTLADDSLNSGDNLDLMLFWHTLGPIDASPALKILLTSRDQQHIYGESISSPITGQHPARWGLDHYAVERLQIPVNANDAPTSAQIRLMVYGDEAWKTSSDSTEITLRDIHINGTQNIPDDATKTDTRFGETIELKAYTLEPASDSIHLRLYWSVREAPPQAYTLALHFWRDGEFIENHDQPPLAINYQTDEWRKGDRLHSDITIPLPENGADELRIGLYDPQSGVRVPVRSDNLSSESDLLILKLEN